MRFNKALVFARLLLARCFPAADKHGNWEHDKHGVWNVVNHKDGERDKHGNESAINTVLGKKGKVF